MKKMHYFNKKTPPHISTLVLLAGIGALNMNIFLPSLPSMAIYFDTEYSIIQLAITLYLACTAVVQLIIGSLSDRYGRRSVLLICLAIFVLASFASIFAPTVEIFLACRIVQASVTAGLTLSRAIVRDLVKPAQAASMIGYVTMGMSVVPMVGPALGGVLDEWYGWQASVILTTIFGAIVWVIAWYDLGETNYQKSASLTEQFKAYPELIKSRRFWGFCISAAAASGMFFAYLGGSPIISSDILHMTPAEIGVAFSLMAFGYMAGNYFSGRHAAHHGINKMMMAGNVISIAGVLGAIALFHLGFTHPMAFFGPLALVGVGNGVTLPSANAGIVSVRPHLAGSASGLGGAIMIAGGAGLASIAGAIQKTEYGPFPLLYLMLFSAILAILASAYVIKVANSLKSESETGEDTPTSTSKNAL